MTLLTNSAEGQSSGTNATTGNTGGTSGNAADAITTSATCTVTFDNTHAAHGVNSYAMTYGATAGNVSFDWSTSMGTQSTIWFRFYLYLTANPSASLRFWGCKAATTCGNLIINTSGKLVFNNASGTALITSTNSVPLNAWFRVEGFLTGSASNGQVEFKLFSTPDSTVPTETQTSVSTANTNTSPTTYLFGNEGTTASSYTYWQDDLGLSSTGYIGPAAGPPPGNLQVNPGPTWLDLFKPGLPRPRQVTPPFPLGAIAATGSFALAPLAFSANGAQTGPDVPSVAPGSTWLDLFKPWVRKPRPVPPAVQGVNATGSFSLAPLAFSGSAGQTSPDIPQVQPGPVWLDLFKPFIQKPRPVPPATQSIAATGSFSLAPLAFTASGSQTSPDIPQANPGPAWLDLFKPAMRKPRPWIPSAPSAGISTSGSFTLAPIAFTANGAQTSPDQPQAQPGPSWLRLFRPWAPRPLPPLPAVQAVNGIASFTLAPLGFSAQAGQSSPDVPQVQPGPLWVRLFRPGLYRPLPPLPAQQAVSAAGSLSLAPLAFSGTAAQTSPDVPQLSPGPAWLRWFKPGIYKPVPPVPAAQSVAGSGSFALAPVTFSGTAGQSSPDLPVAQPGPSWRRLFKPWLKPAPQIPAGVPFAGITGTGSFALAPLALTGQVGQTSPDVPQSVPGPSWLRLFRPWVQRPVPPISAVQSAGTAGSLTLAPLAFSGQGSQSSPDVPAVQPGPWWLRLFKPWITRPVPPPPAVQGTGTSGSLTLAPLAFSGTGTVTGAPPASLSQIAPGPGWLTWFRHQLRPLPPVPVVAVVTKQPTVVVRLGLPSHEWITGDPRHQWKAGV